MVRTQTQDTRFNNEAPIKLKSQQIQTEPKRKTKTERCTNQKLWEHKPTTANANLSDVTPTI